MINLIGKSLGRYHIIEPLGEGGMASVFKAYDTTLERYVAIKVIRTDKGQDDAFLHRFQREAKALARLDHPFILKVLDYGEQEGMPYLVMPFVPGGTLKSRMGKPIPAAQAAALLAPIARALEYAHRQNIIHRDIKPANILIAQSGEPLLSDFGIAKILDQSDQATQLTGTGVGIGTPDYMAPEQWMGQADPRTDVYALGVVFYEMVTGRRPYSADTPAAVLIKHMQDPLPAPKGIIPNLADEAERIIFKALAKKPEERYQDIGTFAAALERLAHRPEVAPELNPDATLDNAGPLVTTRPAPAGVPPTPQSSAEPVRASAHAPTTIPTRWSSRTWIFIVGGLLGLMTLAVLAVVVVLLLRPKKTPLVETTPQSTGIAAAATLPPGETPIPKATTALPATDAPAATDTPAVTPAKEPITQIEGYPEDVPLLTDNNGDLMTSVQEGMTMYMFSTQLPFEQVEQFYRDGFDKQGWTLMNTTTQEGMVFLGYEKGEYGRVIMVSISTQNEQTYIQVMLQQAQE